DVDAPAVERTVNNMLTMPPEHRGTFLWEDPQPVSLTSYGGPTPNSVRIGPVYTPPEFRRRGYASACVAAASQYLLDSGRKFCTLFTDLGNPTSNHIYQVIGYAPVCDVDEYRFGD
ncbi:MAG TPA: GNAT family N-acetyltransferase, partial [Pyrinomonadaceae bacterium]|nr:GNAT family N-acetyltransferase [Pyrinomonadaceae bacterium]